MRWLTDSRRFQVDSSPQLATHPKNGTGLPTVPGQWIQGGWPESGLRVEFREQSPTPVESHDWAVNQS